MDGIINLYKPPGLTSFGCVALVRKLVPGVKAGHAGTLDPAATGVLPVCLGRATRIVECMMNSSKGYRAGIQLGANTDTQDAQGVVLEQFPVPKIEPERLDSILLELTGEIKQTPPAYSAVKYRGKPLYHWTRQGIQIQGRERTIMIYSLRLTQFNPDGQPHLKLEVECSRGTYIRTLAAEIGRMIGCGAHLWSLERYFVGPFILEEALALEELRIIAQQGELDKIILPMDKCLQHLSALTLDQDAARRLKHGQTVDYRQLGLEVLPELQGAPLRIYGPQDHFLGLARWNQAGGSIFLKAVKYLAADEGEDRIWS